MKIKGTLEAISSERDGYGNVNWGLRYIDHKTGKVVEGMISGGESNIYGILHNWNKKDDWDRSILFNISILKRREFGKLTKNWEYAGCTPKDLAKFIKSRLRK